MTDETFWLDLFAVKPKAGERDEEEIAPREAADMTEEEAAYSEVFWGAALASVNATLDGGWGGL